MFMSQPARLVMRYTEKKVMKYYDDGGQGKGNCTWGIGTKAHNGPCTKVELARVVTDADVEREFAKRLSVAEKGVVRRVTVNLTQAQFDALVSLAYNAGLNGCVDVFALVNAGDFDAVAKAIKTMTYGHKFVKHKRVPVFYPGLVSRRTAEAAPFKNAADSPSRSTAP